MDDRQRNTTLAVLFLGVLMGALDIAIVGPALPLIGAEFGLDSRGLSWVFTLYVLGNLIGTPLMAKLSDWFGRRAIYTLDVGLFAVGSLVVALSHGTAAFWLLMLGRAVQGLGAGGIFPVASAVIGDTFPPERRGRALGLIGAVFGLAFLIGPIVGGLLLPLGWPWLFYLNLPIAAVVIVLGWRLLPAEPVARGARFDLMGMAVLGVALAGLALGVSDLDTSRLGASLASPPVFVPLLISVLAWVVLLWHERRVADPVFPAGLLRNRQLAVAFGLTAGAGLGEASLVFMPSLAVAALGVPASVASFLLLPVVLAMAVGSPLAGRLLDRVGPKPVILVGVATLAVGMAALATLGKTLPGYLTAGVLVGLGLSALLGAPIRYITLAETTQLDRSAAQGMVSIFTSVGQLLGGAAVGAVAASAGGAAGGYQAAFAMIGALAVVLFGVALLLRSTGPVRTAEPAASAHA